MPSWAGFAVALALAHLLGRAQKEDSRPGFFGLLQWVLLVGLALTCVLGMLAGEPVAFVALPFIVVSCWPWAFATRVLIPRGMVAAAHFVVRGSTWVWFDDNEGGALVAAAWAALRGGAKPAAMAFVERRLGPDDAGAANLLATGLLAQARGDRAAARQWIASLVEFEGNSAPRMARVLAVQWCAAEAAERGAWARVIELGEDRDADRATRLLAAVGRRLLGRPPVPEPRDLQALLRAVAGRAGFVALVERASAHAPDDATSAPMPPRAEPIAPTTGSPREHALRLHAVLVAAALRRARIDLPHLEAACRAWDRVFDDAPVTKAMRTRAAELGAKLDAPTRLRESVDRDLLAVVRTTELAVGEDPHTKHDSFGRLRRAVRQRLLDELEVLADALHTRVKARKALPVHEEWREYLAIRTAYERAIGLTGEGLHRMAFQIVHASVCALAAWLWNDRKNRVHAHQMFRWLLREAEHVDDAEAIALQKRNVACGS